MAQATVAAATLDTIMAELAALEDPRMRAVKKAFGPDELDTMLREARAPKVHDWLVNYVVKKSVYAEELRQAWFADPDPVVASAGWALNHCLAQTGISHAEHRARAIDIGEIVRRQGGA